MSLYQVNYINGLTVYNWLTIKQVSNLKLKKYIFSIVYIKHTGFK